MKHILMFTAALLVILRYEKQENVHHSESVKLLSSHENSGISYYFKRKGNFICINMEIYIYNIVIVF